MKSNKILYVVCFLIIGITACIRQESIADYPVFKNNEQQVNAQFPETRKYCPENRDVSLSDLSIDPYLAMVVDYQYGSFELHDSSINQNGLYLLSGLESEMIFIPETIPPAGWSYVYKGISADKIWLLLEKTEDWEKLVSVWVTPANPANGHNGREILTIRLDGDFDFFRLNIEPANGQSLTVGPMSRSWETRWLGNKIELAGKYVDSVAIDPQFPYFYIDPFTLNSRIVDITKLYDGVYSPYGEIDIDGQEFVIYYGNLDDDFQQKEFILQDIDNYSKAEIFKWLRNENWIDINYLIGRFRIWTSNTGKVNMAIVQDYGFDLGNDIDLQEMINETEYENIMEPVSIAPNSGYLPDGHMAFLSVASWTSEDGNLFSVYSATEQENILIFDSSEMVLRDYCLNEFEIYPFQLKISPDNRFIAWNSFNKDEDKVNLHIMDLETGFISRIDDIRFRDWVKID